jgi:hypothetical protein
MANATTTATRRGGVAFAALTMMLVGGWSLVQGLASLVQDGTAVVTANTANEIDAAATGWIRLILGAAIALSAFLLLSRAGWAHGVGVGLAALSALVWIFYRPSSPWWASLIIALDLFVAWALIAAPND